jgi:outer membrane protein
VLEVNLQATRDRFEVGDLTRTDVAQSEARLALAQSQLRTAEAR